ncbi:MAG: Spy/CpxP family protein refolding chaperone [Myxococcales bacterium]|nr:Spy/CpxP family protein refolding chaperone [Myxococcales bacterium]
MRGGYTPIVTASRSEASLQVGNGKARHDETRNRETRRTKGRETMRKTTALWLGLMLVLGTTTLTAAGDGGAWGGKGGDHGFLGAHPRMEYFHAERMERVAAFLELTDQQQEEWKALHEQRSGDAAAQREEMRALHERIRGLAASENPDAAAVGELVIEAHRKMSAHRAEAEAVHAEVLSILTPEQRERFEAMQSLRGDRDHRGPSRHHRFMRHHGGSELD